MQLIDNGVIRKLVAEEGKKLYSPSSNTYHDVIYLGKNASPDKYREVNDPFKLSDIEELNGRVDVQTKVNNDQNDLIDISLLAMDEMYMMLEPVLMMMPMTLSMEEDEQPKGVSKMVDLYVAMVMRGLKTIEQVPERYREEVKRILKELEK